MFRTSSRVILLIILWFVALPVRADQPELKEGVKLAIGGSRVHGWAAPEIVDWNNDGLNDVVVGHYTGALRVYLNRGFGKAGMKFEKVEITRLDGFAQAGVPIWGWRFNKTNCVCPGPGRLSPRVVDWDSDGRKDLLIGDGRGAQTRVWRNIGTDKAPAFSTHHVQYLPPDAGIRPYHETVQPFVADWNSDGKHDLIMGRNRGVYVYLNEGVPGKPKFAFDRSRLGTKIRGVFPAERLCPVFTDWDADGKKDLVVGSQRGEVWIANNVGSKQQPQFKNFNRARAAGKIISVGSEARIAVADLDKDGRDDLVVGRSDGSVTFFQSVQPMPVARSLAVPVKRGETVPLELFGTDDQGRALKFSVLSQPKHGSLKGTVPNLMYTPQDDYQGQDEFSYRVTAGDQVSRVATVMIEVQPADKPPTITAQPHDAIVGVGQSARFQVVASGTPPLRYQWKRNGKVIAQAKGPAYVVSETDRREQSKVSVTVTNAAGSVSSRDASLQVKPFPSKDDDVPVIAIRYRSPVVEPAIPGVLTLIRTGNTSVPVRVKLTSRRAHDPVVADVHFVPLPSSVTLKKGQTTADISIVPIDDTLVNGLRSLTFLVAPDPSYRINSKLASASMRFLDDDCPQVSIRAVKGDASKDGASASFEITAQPAPSNDTKITFSVGGSAVAGIDYEALPTSVTIPAGETAATVVIKPYRRPQAVKPTQPEQKKTVVLTLPQNPFTFFDFHHYLTQRGTSTSSVRLTPLETSPEAPKRSGSTENSITDASIEKLRDEVSQLGWILFTAHSDGPGSDYDLFLMRPDGSQLRNLTSTPKFDEFSARVSPDGTKMLYRQVLKGEGEGKRRPIPGGRVSVGDAAVNSWPPNGKLVISGADGSNPKVLGSDGAYAWAAWGPKGKQIACLEVVAPKATTTVQPKRRGKPQTVSYNIVIREAGSLKVVKELPSRGIHRQAVWSPDGKRICGPANILPGKSRLGKGIEYPLGLGKMASLDIESGQLTPMAHFYDWSPVWATDSDGDWFQGGTPQVLHSANNYGICPAYYAMLWRSGLHQEPSELVFAEYKKHIWSGCTSPDDKYAIFVVGGEAWPLQGTMAIIRLADAPIARGQSQLFHELLADFFPALKRGPVLDLRNVRPGFDPHWIPSKRKVD